MAYLVLTKGFFTAKPRSSHVSWAQCKTRPPPQPLSAGAEPKSQGHCWKWHHKLKVVWHIYSSITYNQLMGPFQHILRINQEILSSPQYQARSVSNPPPIFHTTRTEKLDHEVGEDWGTKAS